MKTYFYSVLLLASISFAGISATDSKNKPLLGGNVKIHVTQKGRNVGGERVWIFKKGDLKCLCNNGACENNALKVGVTKAKGDQGQGAVGQVEFQDMAPNTDYTAAIGVKCVQALNSCVNNRGCGISFTSPVNFKTDKNGNAAQVAVIKP